MDIYRYNRNLQDLMAKNEVWNVLEQSEIPKIYPKNQMIYLQGETAEKFYYLKKGRVRIFISSEDGAEKTLTVLERGDIFGEAAFFDGLPRVSCARTLEKSEIITLNQTVLLNCFQKEPELAMELLRFMSKTIRLLSDQVDNMAFLQADKRVARALLRQCRKSAGDPPAISLSHEELGHLAGVSRVTVSRTLNQFSRSGWIITQYCRILVTDPSSLEEFAFS